MTYVLMSSARNSRTNAFRSIAWARTTTGEETILELQGDLKQQPEPMGRSETGALAAHQPSAPGWVNG